MDHDKFKKTKADGSPILCKFCKKPTWYDQVHNRVYDVGGETLHVDNCPARRAHYRNTALDNAEAKRKDRL